MITHRPLSTFGSRRPLTAAGLAAALLLSSTAVAASPAAAAPTPGKSQAGKHTASKGKATSKRSKKKRTAKRSEADGLILTFAATPHAGAHAGTRSDETFAFGGKQFTLVHRTTTGDTTSLWGPLIDTGTIGLIDHQPGSGISSEFQPVPGGFCFDNPDWAPQRRANRAYAAGLRRSIEQIETWRTSAMSRRGLPTGPEIGGRPTVTGKVGTWPTLDRSGAGVALDSATGDVRQITPLGFPDYAVDIAGWAAKPADAAGLRAIADGSEFTDADAFVQGPCQG